MRVGVSRNLTGAYRYSIRFFRAFTADSLPVKAEKNKKTSPVFLAELLSEELS